MDTLDTSEKEYDAIASNSIEMQCKSEGEGKTAESTASTETEDCEKQGQWSELPSLLLEKIYSLLYPPDQLNMSLVCRKWSKGYSSPSVWKTFIFSLNKSQVLMDDCSVMRFARKYSSMFRHVVVFGIRSTDKHLISTWYKHFIAFLQILTSNSQLISVKFLNLITDSLTCSYVCRAIVDFLESQQHLKRAEFHKSLFGFQEFAELLKKLIENCKESLSYLVLRRFFYYDKMDKDSLNLAEILPTLVDLPRLTTLEIDYSLIFENMFVRQPVVIGTLKNCKKTSVLSKIILNYDSEHMKIDDFRGLTSADWRFLKSLCIDLQVEFNFTSDSPSRREVEFFFVPDMPLTRLYFAYDKMNLGLHQSSLREIDVLLNKLLACKTNEHLVSLRLKWVLPIPDVASTFIPFLQACKKLKKMELSIVYPANGIALLMQSWLKNRPESLEKVYIAFSGLSVRDDFRTFMSSVEEFESPLAKVGLNFDVDFVFGMGQRLF